MKIKITLRNQYKNSNMGKVRYHQSADDDERKRKLWVEYKMVQVFQRVVWQYLL